MNKKIVFFLFYSSVSSISVEGQTGYIIFWWIRELLGRAGFEPA